MGWTVGIVLTGVVTLTTLVVGLYVFISRSSSTPTASTESVRDSPARRTQSSPSQAQAQAPGAKPARLPLPSPPATKALRAPTGSAWPSGTLSSDLALIATNIPPSALHKSTAVVLDVKSDRYVQISPGDQLEKLEVVSIATDWVQLRQAGSYSWVGYRKGEKRPTRARHSRGRNESPPPRVRRRARGEPSVSLKWIVGRLNLAGELEDHIRPTLTAKGLQVGRVTKGFRRIGLRMGDVVQQSGGFPVNSLEQLRNGMQRAAHSGGSGSITVLRKGRKVKLSFGVR